MSYQCVVTAIMDSSRQFVAAGYKIPKGTALRCAVYAMHHDSSLWKDAEVLLCPCPPPRAA